MGKEKTIGLLFVFCLLEDGRRGEEREGEERKGKQAGMQASKCQDTCMYIRCKTYSRYYSFLGTIVLTTLSINQSAHLSICLSICLSINQLIYPSVYPSIYLSIVHVQRVLAYLLASLLACLLAGFCCLFFLLLRGRPNYIISYHVMLHSHIYYYLLGNYRRFCLGEDLFLLCFSHLQFFLFCFANTSAQDKG